MNWSKLIRTKTWNFSDYSSAGQIGHLNNLLGSMLPYNYNINNLSAGSHLLFGNQLNINIGTDGYDNYQAPMEDGNQLFKRRMWVKGDIEWYSLGALNKPLNCVERVQQARLINQQMFVNIARTFYQDNNEILKESRVLMYTNNDYKLPSEPSSLMEPYVPRGNLSMPDFSFSQLITFSASDVLKYSCLTFNLHKIHLDHHYSISEGLPGIIVQGPLLVTTVLQWFQRLYPDVSIAKFTYKNLKPVEINKVYDLGVVNNNGQFALHILRDGQSYLQGTLK